MTKIYFVGDAHFGKTYPYRKNYVLNISERSLDVINNCEKIIKEAIREKADFVIFLGDLYHRKSISPTIRKIVRNKIFLPLNQNKIKTIILGGNHDSTRNPQRGVDIQELANFSNVDVYTSIESKITDINGSKIGFIFLPYLHFDVLVNIFKEKRIISEDFLEDKDNFIVAQHIFRNFIKQICENKLKECDKRILLGHYYLEGAKIRETNNPSMIYGEFHFNKEMIQKQFFDLVIFGHIHLKQTMWNDDRIIIPGSIDRIDMGERNSDKFYTVYDVENNEIEFRKIECRKLLKYEIEIPDDAEDLTKFILNNLPEREEIKEAVCKIHIHYPKGKETSIDKYQIESYFKSSYNADLSYLEEALKKSPKLREVNLDPKSLFKDFLEQKYAGHNYYKDLKSIGLELLDRELSLVDLTAKGSLSIKSIDMQYFNKYGNGPNKINFDEDLYVIKGPTGSGKSSILDAITFALFKRNSRKDVGLTLDEILYKGGYVSLQLLIGDNVLSVKRGHTSPKLQIRYNGDPLFSGLSIPEKENKLVDIIGYDYEGFTSSFFIRQQELQIFSTLTTEKRQQRLVKLFKLKIFSNIYQNLKSAIDNFKGKKATLEGETIGLKEFLEELPQKERKLQEIKEELQARGELQTELSKAVKDLKEKSEATQVDAFNYTTTQKSIEELKEKIEDNRLELREYKQQQEEYNKLQDKLQKLPDVKKKRKELQIKKEEIESVIHELELLQSEITSNKNLLQQTEKQYNEQLEHLLTQINEKDASLKRLDTTITKDDAFDILKDIGMLTERFYRLQNVEIPMAQEYNDTTRISEFISLESQTNKQLDEIKPKEKKITKVIFIADEIKSDKETIMNQYNGIEKKKISEVSTLSETIRTLKKEMKQKGVISEFKELLNKIKEEFKTIEDVENEREGLESKLKEIKDFSVVIEKSEKDLKQKENDLEKLDKELLKLEPFYQQYLEIANQYGKKQQELQELDKKIEGLKVEIDLIGKDIEKIKVKESKIKRIKKEIQKVKENIEIYTLLREDIFHLNGVPKFAVEQILPAISISASQILNDLTDGRFNQITFKSLKGKRVGFEINVFDGERDREASSFSGGEKTQINAAIRFAIMERIAEIPDTTGALFRKSNTLFIDEGDLGTLDDETARQRFVEKIFELKSMFKKIILITHLEDVAEQFPNRIVIGWDRFGNSKIF